MRDAAGSSPTALRYARAPQRPWRQVGGVVFVARPGGDAARLEGSAAAVWLVLGVPGTVADVTARLVEAAGPIPLDGERHLRQSLDLLVEAGWVETA